MPEPVNTIDPAAYQPDVWSDAGQALEGFHRALLTLCAARSDLFASVSSMWASSRALAD